MASISLLDEPNPYKIKTLNHNNELLPLIKDENFNSEMPRQLLPKSYRLTGAFYCINFKKLISYKQVLYPGSIGFITKYFPNIDSKDDLDYLHYLMMREKLPKEFISLIKTDENK